jgi:GH24 family phage-related lysozyme (muramidase)
MNISDLGIKSIIGWECDGEAGYNHSPEWPGEQSGVTIGIGYDLGQTPANEITQAWRTYVSAQDLEILVGLSGITGERAQEILPHVRHLKFTWQTAEKVFLESTLPIHYLRTLRIYPQVIDLHGHCAGALTSLVFNRGPKLTGTDGRRVEMAEIQKLLQQNDLQAIPEQFEKMRRLWSPKSGLYRRRKEEADLFRLGLSLTGE